MTAHRKDRVEETYRRGISELLLFEAKNPLFQEVTVTHVIFSKDLKLAKVYYHCTGGKSRDRDLQKAFRTAHGFLRHEMSARINLKTVPDIKFFYNDTFDEKERIEQLFDKIQGAENAAGTQDKVK